jgi:regulator of CtrA degradation
MSESKPSNGPAAVSFASRLLESPAFRTLFKEGMGLVEETASYLDGPGKQEARLLDRSAALSYATESMRLTTRLMQLASWLLVQRALNEGEITAAQGRDEKQKLRLAPAATALAPAAYAALPERLRDLIERTSQVQGRIERLDTQLRHEEEVARDNPVELQLSRLRAAFKDAGD